MPRRPGGGAAKRQLALAVLVIGVASFALGNRTSDRVPLPTPDLSPNGGVEVDPADGSIHVDGRGVEVEIVLDEVVSGLHLRGHHTLDLPVGAIDGDPGRNGGLRIEGEEVRIEGTFYLQADAVIRGDHVVLDASAIGVDVVVAGDATVSGDSIVFTGPGGSTELSGPVAFTSGGRGRLRGTGSPETLRWLNPPETFELNRPGYRQFLSWAGEGRVEMGDQVFSGEFGRVSVRDLDITIVRSEGRVRAEGTGRVQQVILDGAPQLRTRVTVDGIVVHRKVAAGERSRFTWAPRNVGGFDMVMTRIRPASESARWLAFGLAGIDRSYGGEERPAHGGVTDGFRRGSNIRSVIAPFSADRRDITVAVPSRASPGTYRAEVVIEGNFDPVTVTFEVEVE